MASSEPVRTEDLILWARRQGAYVSTKLSFIGEAGQTRVLCHDAFAEDETLVQIPKDWCFSRLTSSLAPLTLPSLDYNGIPSSLLESLLLATHLYYEFQLGRRSRFFTYLSSLPSCPPCLAGFARSSARAVLAGSQAALRMDKGLEISLDVAASFFQNYTLKLLPTEGFTSPQLETYLRCYALVSSRCFEIDSVHGLALVPIADLFNHSDEPDVELRSDDPPTQGILRSNSVELQAISGRPVVVGGYDEVLNTYGTLSNAHLICRYGFHIEGNSFDFVTFKLPHQLCSLSIQAGSLRSGLGVWTSSALTIDSDLVCGLPLAGEPSPEAFAEECSVFADADGRFSFRSWRETVLRCAHALGMHLDLATFVEVWHLQQACYDADVADGKMPTSSLMGTSPHTIRLVHLLADTICQCIGDRLGIYYGADSDIEQMFDLRRRTNDGLQGDDTGLLLSYVIAERVLWQGILERWCHVLEVSQEVLADLA